MTRPVLLGTAVVLAAGLLVGCGSTAPPAKPPTPVPVADDVPANTAALVAADDTLGIDLLTSPATPQDGNLAISPAGVATALQMVAAGARGRTATELAHVLHLPDAAAAATSAQALLTGLGATERDTRNTLRVANTVWTQHGLRLERAFGDTLRNRFDSSSHTADFTRDPDAATNAVNRAVSGQTDGMIPQLFPPNSLDSTTQLVLTNAIYLKASWASAFPVDRTAPGRFTRGDGSVVRVPMMRSTSPEADQPSLYGHATGPGYQVVTLPYVGGRLAFSVLLPTGSSLSPLLDVLRDKGLPTVLGAVRPSTCSVLLPKFSLRTDLDLTATLASLGMPSAFGADADFSGITRDEALSIQTVRHDAVVDVDEHGTTAAAATGVGMQTSAAVQACVVAVDHPFLFVITDTATGAPLFLGRVTDPS
jgi:serpin B